MLFKTLAAELGGRGVRANTIAPGVVETPLTAPIKARPEWYAAYADKSILRRWAQPSEMVGAVVYLASDASSYVTGTTIFVDGGWTAADGRFDPRSLRCRAMSYDRCRCTDRLHAAAGAHPERARPGSRARRATGRRPRRPTVAEARAESPRRLDLAQALEDLGAIEARAVPELIGAREAAAVRQQIAHGEVARGVGVVELEAG